MTPLTPKERDAFLDSAAIAALAVNANLFATFNSETLGAFAYEVADALLAERDRRTDNPTA